MRPQHERSPLLRMVHHRLNAAKGLMRLFRKGVETFEVQPGDDLSFLL